MDNQTQNHTLENSENTENAHTSNEQPVLPSDGEKEQLARQEEEPKQGQQDQREMGGNNNNSELVLNQQNLTHATEMDQVPNQSDDLGGHEEDALHPSLPLMKCIAVIKKGKGSMAHEKILTQPSCHLFYPKVDELYQYVDSILEQKTMDLQEKKH